MQTSNVVKVLFEVIAAIFVFFTKTGKDNLLVAGLH